MPEVAAADATLWWVMLGLAAVVAVVVIILLTLLVRFVATIDRNVVQVRDTAKAITKNTANTKLIAPTADAVDGVLAEGLQHHLFLGRVLGKVRA
jgi:hypothetical protein